MIPIACHVGMCQGKLSQNNVTPSQALIRAGKLTITGTAFRGYELNYRAIPLAAEAHQGPLPSSYSFVTIEAANVILTAIKKAEDDNSVIFRSYEFEGKPSQVRLCLPEAVTQAVEPNLMEKEEHSISRGPGRKKLTTPIGADVIKSVKVTIHNSAGGARPPRYRLGIELDSSPVRRE